VATVKIDTIGYDRQYSYAGNGAYTVQKQASEILYPQNITTTQLSPISDDNSYVYTAPQSSTHLDIVSFEGGDALNGILVGFLIQFRIYP
jgi:hypothetical protein